MASSIVVKGEAQLKAALARVAAAAHAASVAAVAQEVDTVQAHAVGLAPNRTGELDAGIEGKASGVEGQVEATARHSVFVEHGTYKDEAQPFMRPAAEASRHRFPLAVAKLISAAVKSAGR